MNDKDFSSLNEAEFDLYLQELSDVPPPPAVSDELSPWRTAMSRILWGIGWTTITVNLFHLEIILPAVGMIMLLLGFRSLRQENRWFAMGYGCAWIRLIWWLVYFAISLTVFQNDAPVVDFQHIVGNLMVVPTIGMFLSLRNGIRAVQRKAGLPEEGGTGLLVCEVLLFLLALIRFTGWLTLIFLAIYILTLRELSRTSKTMEEAGYAVSPAPVHISDSAAKGAYAAAIACIVIFCYLFLAKYPMDWKPAQAVTGGSVQTVRQELLDLGFPEEVLNDLTEEELLACDGADFVLVESKEHQLDRKTGFSLTLEQPENLLRVTHVGLRFRGERDDWKIIHHFRWLSNDGFCGTEAIQLWPAYWHSGNWLLSGDFRGRVLYDRDGETFASGYHFLGSMETNGWFGPSQDVYAAFSLPNRGENQRGYLIYDTQAATVPSLTLHSWFNYVHQYTRLHYPVQTALEAERTGSPNLGWVFNTEQTAIQINTYTDPPTNMDVNGD